LTKKSILVADFNRFLHNFCDNLSVAYFLGHPLCPSSSKIELYRFCTTRETKLKTIEHAATSPPIDLYYYFVVIIKQQNTQPRKPSTIGLQQ